jgi:hypothetical protein
MNLSIYSCSICVLIVSGDELLFGTYKNVALLVVTLFMNHSQHATQTSNHLEIYQHQNMDKRASKDELGDLLNPLR